MEGAEREREREGGYRSGDGRGIGVCGDRQQELRAALWGWLSSAAASTVTRPCLFPTVTDSPLFATGGERAYAGPVAEVRAVRAGGGACVKGDACQRVESLARFLHQVMGV